METMVDVIAPDAFFRAPGAGGPAPSADDKLAMLEPTNRFEWCFDARRLDALDRLPRVLAHAPVTDRTREVDGAWRIAGRTFERTMLVRDYAPDEAGWRRLQQAAADRAAERAAAGADRAAE